MTDQPENLSPHVLRQIQAEIGDIKDQLTVLTGICVRLEGSVEGLILEVRGLRNRFDRFERRLPQDS